LIWIWNHIFVFDQPDPTRFFSTQQIRHNDFFFLRPSESDRHRYDGLDGCSFPLSNYTRRTPRHATYTIHGNGDGGGGVGRRASECVVRAACQLEAMRTNERSSRCGTLFRFPCFLFVSFFIPVHILFFLVLYLEFPLNLCV